MFPAAFPAAGLMGEAVPDISPGMLDALGAPSVQVRMISAIAGGQNDVGDAESSLTIPAPREKAEATAGSSRPLRRALAQAGLEHLAQAGRHAVEVGLAGDNAVQDRRGAPGAERLLAGRGVRDNAGE